MKLFLSLSTSSHGFWWARGGEGAFSVWVSFGKKRGGRRKVESELFLGPSDRPLVVHSPLSWGCEGGAADEDGWGFQFSSVY